MATTKIKLWQLQSAPDGGRLLITDPNGTLAYLLPDLETAQPLLTIGENGMPQWTTNLALDKALEALSRLDTALAGANGYTDQKIAALVDGAPVALDTLTELAAKLSEEDEALAALILQVDSRAAKNEVYTQDDVNALLLTRLSDAKSYTDTLKDAIAGAVKVSRTAMLYMPESLIDGQQFSLADMQLMDGDALPAGVNLDISQVFINGQLGVKSYDYAVLHQGTPIDQIRVLFPAINKPDQTASMMVLVRWEEPLQIAFPPAPPVNV